MDSILVYFLKANVLISIFTLLYLFLFRRETHFHLNRFFLLTGIASALLIPIIRISIQTIQSVQIPVNEFTIPQFIETPLETINPETTVSESIKISIFDVLKTIYFAGLLLLSLRFVLFIRKLLSLINKGVLRRIGNTFFVATSQQVQPFSFFNFVFYNAEIATKPDFDTIVAHEKIHVRQLHSIDLLLTEILVVLFWFNPFVFLQRNAVRANHEFLADAAVLNRGTDKLESLQTLAVQATSHQFGEFGSHFKSSTLKNRIIMITKKKSTFIRSLKYLLVLPVMAVLFFSFTIREISDTIQTIIESAENESIHIKKGSVFTLPAGNQIDYFGTSSITRINADKIRISDVEEMTSGNLKFHGDLFEFNSKEKILTVLGDSCFMEVLDEASLFPFNFSKINLESKKLIFPFKGDKPVNVTSGFGKRIHPINKTKNMHNGMDFSAPKGTPSIAIAKGKVRVLENKPKSYGKYIIIDHPNGFSSLYAQLSDYNIEIGEEINQGDIIGYVGSSGISTGPHLHLELKKDGKHVNPAEYIEKD